MPEETILQSVSQEKEALKKSGNIAQAEAYLSGMGTDIDGYYQNNMENIRKDFYIAAYLEPIRAEFVKTVPLWETDEQGNASNERFSRLWSNKLAELANAYLQQDGIDFLISVQEEGG